MGNRAKEIRRKNSSSAPTAEEKTGGSDRQRKSGRRNSLQFSGRENPSVNDLPLSPQNLIYLQRTIGNRAVGRLLQAKLEISQPGDEYEREADQVAEQVLRMPDHETTDLSQAVGDRIQRFIPEPGDELQRQTTEEEQRKRPEEDKVQRKEANAANLVLRQGLPEEEKRKRPEEGGVQMKQDSALDQGMSPEEDPRKRLEETVQPKEQAGEATTSLSSVETQMESLSGGGEPLPGTVRSYFESRFGQDFGDVRVHQGGQAAETARAINAKAYTRDKDIVFGAGEYSPDTDAGKKLLAHELTHVVQQGKGRLRKPFKAEGNLRHSDRQSGGQQVFRQGLLNAGEEVAAINFNNARYDERSIRVIQIITGAAVDGQFGRLSAEAVAAFQNANGLGVDGKVGELTLNVMVTNRAAAGLHEHAIQLVIDLFNLNVTRDTLTVHFDPALAVAGATTFESGNLRVIRVGTPAFTSAADLRAAIVAQLTAPAPAPAAVGPRPAHLTNAAELEAIQFNRIRFTDRRSVLAIQGLVGTRLDGVIGRDTVERIAEFQNVNGLTVDGKVGDGETLPVMVNQLIAANNQNAAIRLIVDFYNIRDDGNLLDVFFDPGVAANASTDFRPNEPVRVRVGPSGMAQPFPGIVHTIAHEFEHVRRLKQGIVSAATHEFLGEAIEILSQGMREEDLEALAPGTPGFVAGFADDAGRALTNWNAMPLADQQRFRNRFIEVRQRVRDRIAAGTAAQQALHATLLANYNAVVLPPP